ncbi:MAG: hypothetical protein Q8P54_00500 [bacterium]|nr:hypothetical protein [bacterium]
MKKDYERFLKLNPEEFDQDEEKGWRKLDKEGKSLEAAEVIETYLDMNKDKLRDGSADNAELEKVMHFHIGQLLSFSGSKHYEEAIQHFQKSLQPNREGWNYYVGGTVAFLQKDKKNLNQNIKGLQDLERKLGIGIGNLDILEHFAVSLRKGETSYKKAMNGLEAAN